MEAQKRDGILLAIGIALLVAGFIFLIYMPGKNSEAQLQLEIQTAEAAVEAAPDRLVEITRLKNEIDARSEYLRETRHVVAPSADLHRLVRDVADLAKIADLTITRQEPGRPETFETYERVPFRLSVEGKFAGLAHFLYGLEQESRLIQIDELELNSKERRNKGVITGDIRFSVFVDRTESSDSNENRASPIRPFADT